MDRFDTRSIKRWLVMVRAEYAAWENLLNSLNVFPVPDGDTGTNLRSSLDGAMDVLEENLRDATELLQSFARKLARSAHGNSGVILSQIMLGVASTYSRLRGEGGQDTDSFPRAHEFAELLASAARAARQSVQEPVEGTILSVADAAASGAQKAAAAGASLRETSRAALQDAREHLQTTRDMLPELQGAGVVDAGGLGYVVLLECLDRVMQGQTGLPAASRHTWMQPEEDVLGGHCSVEVGGPAFEVMCRLRLQDDRAIAQVRSDLTPLGDSLVVAGSEGDYSVHVHVDDVLAALNICQLAGRVSRIKLTHFASQHDASAAPAASAAVLVATSSKVLREYSRALGARVVPGVPSVGHVRRALADDDRPQIMLADSVQGLDALQLAARKARIAATIIEPPTAVSLLVVMEQMVGLAGDEASAVAQEISSGMQIASAPRREDMPVWVAQIRRARGIELATILAQPSGQTRVERAATFLQKENPGVEVRLVYADVVSLAQVGLEK